MSKRRSREKSSAHSCRPSTEKCQTSAATQEKVNEIRLSAWRHAVGKGHEGDDSGSDEEEEEKRHGEGTYGAGTSFNKLYSLTYYADMVTRTLAHYLALYHGDGHHSVQSVLELSGTWSCIICLSTVHRVEAVWSCDQCSCLFHLMCIQQWARDCLNLVQQSTLSPDLFPDLAATKNWSCPKCRRDYPHSQIPRTYYCFCKKKVRYM